MAAVVAAVVAATLPAVAGAQVPTPERLAGADRFATAAAVSAGTFDPGVARAFVATGEAFPDALAGGPLAGRNDAPVLLTGRDALPGSTADELDRLRPGTITVLGGSNAISEQVVAQLQAHTEGTVNRVGGDSRFATAAAISAAAFPQPGVATAYVATGANFPDALAGGAAGAAGGGPVLLTGLDDLPVETRAELQRLRPASIAVLGGTAAVADTVLTELAELTDGEVRRLSGPDRYTTAAAVAADSYPDQAAAVFLATGGGFPDALAGAPAAGRAGGPLLLVQHECAPAPVVAAIGRLAPERLVVLGGTAAVSDAAGALQPCTGDPGDPPGSPPSTDLPPPPTFDVDTSLEPQVATLEPLDDGQPRPVARAADTLGTTFDFAESELMVMADGAELAALLDRWDGEVLVTHDFAGAGLDQIDPVHLVRIDAELADPAGLPDDARRLDPLSQGAHRVSSAAGLGTIAASLGESADGMVVGLNALDQGAGIPEGTTAEAATGPGSPPAGLPWSTDAFSWAYMDAANPMGMGIADAWQRLHAEGALNGPLQVGVIDDGFGTTDNDRPANSSGFGPGFGNAGIIGCGANPCPWHGHNVASALAAVPDNDVGAAGSGGPVSRLIMVQRGTGVDGTVQALLTAADEGARLMNMSFRWQLPASMASTLDPMQRVLSGLELHHNRVLFAAAGNDGADVDAVTCSGGTCWEPTLYAPCEFDIEVTCVGGVTTGTRNRHPNSNFGTSVDVFGPYTVFVGPDPANPGVQVVNGTSFASPVVAGVGALLWEAFLTRPPFSNPGSRQVRQTIVDSANPSPDAQVTRVLNATGAVDRIVGANSPPSVRITDPPDGTAVPYGTGIRVTTVASDAEDGEPCCLVRFASTRAEDTVFGSSGTGLVTPRSPGPRTITATATDSRGAVGPPATVTIDATNTPPAVAISLQPDGASLFAGVDYPYRGSITDENQGDAITCDALTWVVTPADAPLQLGCRPRIAISEPGDHTITLNGADEFGLTATAAISVGVQAIPPNSPPIVQIYNPLPGDAFAAGAPAIMLDGLGFLEPGETSPISYRWTQRKVETGTLTELGDTRTVSWSCPSQTFGTYERVLTLTATDDDGTGSAAVTVTCERGPN